MQRTQISSVGLPSRIPIAVRSDTGKVFARERV